MPKQPTRPDARKEETPELSPLARRLLRRLTEPLGLIDVKHAARHHERLTSLLAGRSRLLEQLLARYAAADEAPQEGQSLLMQRWRGQPGLAPPSVSGPALPADPSPPPVPQTFLAPPTLGAAGVSPPPPAAPTPPAPQPPPAQKLRVSRDSAARAMRRDPKTGTEPTRKTDATPPHATPAPPAAPVSKPGSLPRAAEQTHAPRHEPAETNLFVREAERGHATEPAAGEATTTTGGISGERAKPAGRAEGRAEEVSQAMPAPTMPLLKRQEPAGPREPVGSRVEAVHKPAPPTAVPDDSKPASDDPKAVTGDAKSTRVSERETRAAGPQGVVQTRPAADMPLARAAIPSDVRAGVRLAESAGDGGIMSAGAGGALSAGTSAAKNARAGVVSAGAGVVSAEVRGVPDAGPAEIVWRKSDGRAAAGGEARPAAGTQRDSAATHASADAEGTRAPSGQGRGADDPAPTPAARPEVDLGRLTDNVMRAISRRLAVERERRGMRP